MEKVVIDIEGRFTDNVTSAATGAVGALERLAKKTVFVKFNANASPFLKVLNKAESLANKFGHKKISATLNAVDKATRVLGNVWNFGLKIGGKVWRATVTVVDKATAPIRGIFKLLKNPVFQVGTALGLSFGAANMIQTYSDFESTMSEVGAISGATGRDFDALTAKAKQMGATTKYTATEAGQAMTYMAMAGWKSQDMLDGIEGIMNLAAASGENLATTSDIVTDALTAFGKTAKDSTHFADVMAAASSNANTNVSLLGESFKYVAPVAGAFGYSIEDTAIALGLMANAGVKGSQAGTALRFAISSLNSPTSQAQALMQKYGVSLARTDGQSKTLLELTKDLRKTFGNLGVSATDSTGALKDYSTIMSEAKDSTRLSAEQMEKLSALSTIFGERALPGMLAMINAEEGDFQDLSDAIYGADGAAKRMAKTMMDNLKGSLDLLKSAAEGAILTIMDKFGPHMRTFVDWLAGNMPKIGNTVGNALDFIGTKVTKISGKIKEITGGADWKFGNIGDKIKLLWDGLVADPLSEWWNGGGREKAIETAGNIGKDLGEILKTGLLTIFGMTDALNGSGSAAMSAGTSIAKSFAEGFAEGFDASLITGKLKEALGNIWDAIPGWAKFLTGGIIGSKVVGGLSKAVLGGIDLYKNAAKVIGSANAGTGLLGLGANAAIMLGAGNRAGGASLSAGALSAIGLGSIAGGLISGVGLISAYNDFKNARNATNELDRQANNARGSGKVLGFGTGAAVGAATGAHFFGIGAIPGVLIGGGIGTLIGWTSGDNAARNIESAKFATEEMKAAIQDTNMSAEELARTFDKAVYTDMKKRFGDIELSLAEIQRLSDQIVWGDNLSTFSAYNDAAQTAAADLQSYQTAFGDTSKWMWKAGFGVKFNEEEVGNIKAAFDEQINAAKDYVSDKHYELTQAVKLILKPESDSAKNILDSNNTFFQKLQAQMDSDTLELSETVDLALKDGVITADEQSLISKAQEKVNKIMEDLSNAEFEANLDLIKLKFGNGKLSLDTYDSFMSQLQTTLDSRLSSSDQAFISLAATAKLKYQYGESTFDEYKTEVENLMEKYQVNIDELRVKVEGFVFDILGDAYTDVLGPNAAAKLQKALSDSLKSNVDPAKWTSEDVQKFLGIEGMEEEAANGLGRMLSGINALLDPLNVNPEVTVDPNLKVRDISGELENNILMDNVFSVDANVEANWTYNEFDQSLLSPDGQFSVSIDALADVGWTLGGDELNPKLLSPDGKYCIPITAEAAVTWTTKAGQALDTSEIVPETTETVTREVTVETKAVPSENGVDTSAITYQITPDTETVDFTVQTNPTYVLAEGSTPDLSSITSQIPTTTDPVTITVPTELNLALAEGSTTDLSTITSQIPQTTESVTVNVPITATYNTHKFPGQQVADFGVQPQYDFTTVVVIAPSYIVSPKFTGSRSIFGIQSSYSIGTTVTINVSYSVNKGAMPNLTAGIPRARGGIIGPNGPMGFAVGGMVRGGPQLVTVAEEGAPEMIIPLGSHRRQRGIELWERAGKLLGIPGLANGGIAGNAGDTDKDSGLFRQRSIQKTEPLNLPEHDSESLSSGNGETTISVNVGGVTLHFNINGSDDDAIASAIKDREEEIADSVAKVFKKAALEVFANTPAQGGRTT